MLFVQLFRKESNRTLGWLFTVVFELFLVSAVSHVHSVLRTARCSASALFGFFIYRSETGGGGGSVWCGPVQ